MIRRGLLAPRSPVTVVAVIAGVAAVLAVLAFTGDDPGTRRSFPSADGERGQVLSGAGPTGDLCQGVPIGVEDDPHSVLSRHPPGTTYCFSTGTHRVNEPLAPQRGDSILGQPGAVLSGSVEITGWWEVERGWAARGRLPRTLNENGTCSRQAPGCTLTHDVFLDGRRLRRVLTAEQVTPGTFHADYRTNTITIGSEPWEHLVEQAAAPSLVRSTQDDVTVRNLVLEQAANEAQTGAVESRQVSPHRTGTGWHVEHNDIRLNHGVGIGVADGAVVSGNRVLDQGQLGLGVWGRGVKIHANEVARNGAVGYDPEWEAGGIKSWQTTGTVLTRNHVHHNRGPGLWSDGGCTFTTYDRNVITDNWGAGIQHEISYDARIVRNRIMRNGVRHKGWAWEAGIQVQSSGARGSITIARNVVAGNANAITIVESGDRRHEPPTPHGPHAVRNILVHHNTITMYGGQSTGVFQDIGEHGIFAGAVRFVANTYRVDSTAEPHFAWADDHLTWSEWLGPGVGQDRGGTLVLLGTTPP